MYWSRTVRPKVLFILASFMAAVWLFLEVSEDVMEGEVQALDRALLLALRMPGDPATARGPLWLESVARDITALGSITVLGLVITAVTLFLLLASQRRLALFVLLASSGGALLTLLLKQIFSRPRPDLFMHGDVVVTASFPSGHAMISAVVYLTLGALLAKIVIRHTLKIYLMTVAVLLTGMIGLSRVYLGVHWPTDVLAGWVAGAGWALGCWGVAELINVRAESNA